jgi:hypothetical protein
MAFSDRPPGVERKGERLPLGVTVPAKDEFMLKNRPSARDQLKLNSKATSSNILSIWARFTKVSAPNVFTCRTMYTIPRFNLTTNNISVGSLVFGQEWPHG